MIEVPVNLQDAGCQIHIINKTYNCGVNSQGQ